MLDSPTFSKFVDLDRLLSLRINIGLAESAWDQVMVAISSHWIWFVFFGFWAFLSKGKSHRWFILLIAILAVGLSDIFAFEILKPWFGRVRPCKAYGFVRIVHSCGGMLSFPSNHASNSMTLAATVAFWDRRSIGILLIAFAMMVSFSRVYLGVHYLGDVVFGIIMGLVWAGLATLLVSKLPALSKFKLRLQPGG